MEGQTGCRPDAQDMGFPYFPGHRLYYFLPELRYRGSSGQAHPDGHPAVQRLGLPHAGTVAPPAIPAGGRRGRRRGRRTGLSAQRGSPLRGHYRSGKQRIHDEGFPPDEPHHENHGVERQQLCPPPAGIRLFGSRHSVHQEN